MTHWLLYQNPFKLTPDTNTYNNSYNDDDDDNKTYGSIICFTICGWFEALRQRIDFQKATKHQKSYIESPIRVVLNSDFTVHRLIRLLEKLMQCLSRQESTRNENLVCMSVRFGHFHCLSANVCLLSCRRCDKSPKYVGIFGRMRFFFGSPTVQTKE